MKPAQFLKLLTIVRTADDNLTDTIGAIALYILEQHHKHGNRTPYLQLRCAIDGGQDKWGAFGVKDAMVRGVSAGMARLFAGIKLAARDENADVELLAQEAASIGIATRAEAREEAKYKREQRKAAEAKETKAAEKAHKPTGMLIDCGGVGTELTPAETIALLKTLKALREQDTIADIIDGMVTEVSEPGHALAVV